MKTNPSSFEASKKFLFSKGCQTKRLTDLNYDGVVLHTDSASSGSLRILVKISKNSAVVVDLYSKQDLGSDWKLITIVKSGDKITWYLDNLQHGNNSIKAEIFGGCDELFGTIYKPVIGMQKSIDNAERFNGIIDDFRIYNYALSAAEVADIYSR